MRKCTFNFPEISNLIIWNLVLYPDNELKLTVTVPKSMLDFEFTEDTVDVCDLTDLPIIKPAPFTILKKLITELGILIKIYNLDSFYFIANTHKKGLVFACLIRKYLPEFPGWNCQIIDNYQFFFKKNNELLVVQLIYGCTI
ncbi:MAG: hypothetical protein IPL31_02020 [Saprospiraceae bacterium]|nr:hypothetical protein [Saprospiraceae bacterium]